jgi:hypothetical protein
MPKPGALAIQELEEGRIYVRRPEEDQAPALPEAK